MGEFREIFGRYTKELDRLSTSAGNASAIVKDAKSLWKAVNEYYDVLYAQVIIIEKEIENRRKTEPRRRVHVPVGYQYDESSGYYNEKSGEGGVKYISNILEAGDNNDIFMEASKILAEEIIKAVKENKEFDHQYFIDRLIKVAYNPKIFFIYNSIANAQRYVKINFGDVAGNLEDYAHGVAEARKTFKVKNWHKLSQHFWEEKLYKPAREGIPVPSKKKKKGSTSPEEKTAKMVTAYWVTMYKRMDASGKIAPFWDIINNGTPEYMSSSRGGNPYPTATRTDFIGKAENRINTLIRGDLHTRWGWEERDVDVTKELRNILNLQDYMQGLSTLLDEIKELLKNLESPGIGGPIVPQEITKVIEKTTERLGRKVAEIKLDKLADLILAIKSNDFSNLSITADGRYEVTQALAKQLGLKRTRVTVNVIRKIMFQMGILD